MHANDAQSIAEQHFAMLVAALEAGQSDSLTRYLTVASRFHTYSLNNQFLIAAQCPAARRVAGYQAWASPRPLGATRREGYRDPCADHAAAAGRPHRRRHAG